MKIKVHFESHKDIIIHELEKAKVEVKIAVAWINFKEYLDIFNKVLDNLVKLTIICSDNKQNRAHQAVINHLSSRNAEVRLLKMPRATNHMHNKFAIIDNKTILNGSFNWSLNAQKSFENILVVSGASEALLKFNDEFDKLTRIESQSIKELQKKVKCNINVCSGDRFNLLVFSAGTTKYSETSGDIIEICDTCDYKSVIERCVSNTQIHILLNELRCCADEAEYEIMNRIISSFLNEYMNDGNLIHGIGRVYKGLDYSGEDVVETNIMWKNKFVGNRLPDSFETNFDVLYDN